MARAFPNQLLGQVPLETLQTFRKLKKLPDDYSLWYSFPQIKQPDSPLRPDFLILWQERFGFLIHVASTTQALAETALQGNLFNPSESITAADLGRAEGEILNNFSAELDDDLPLRHLVVFPNVEHNTIDTISLQRSQKPGSSFLGLKQLGEKRLPQFLESIALAEIPAPLIVHLRHHFSPEVSVPDTFSATRLRDRQTAATLGASLLDFDQEWCMKNDLYLSGESREILAEGSPTYRTQLVTGVAGSGKSLVLLYRALMNARLNPDARILVLTHNRPISNELQRRFTRLSSKPHAIDCFTFFQWAAANLPNWPERILSADEQRQIIESLIHDSQLEVTFLIDEIGFIKDHGIHRKTDYRELDRTGRGRSLAPPQREHVWQLYKAYQQHLLHHQLIDWHGIAMRFQHAVTTGSCILRKYDCILIDEAQFFAKAWFDVVRSALCDGGQLFLSADPTQGFLKRRQSWLASGIEVRGRTTRLKKAYRNTRAILEFAAAFFRQRQAHNPLIARDELNIPDPDQLAEMPDQGTPPTIISIPNSQDLHLRAAHEVKSLRDQGLLAGQLIILHAHSRQLDTFQNLLATILGSPALIHQARDGILPKDAFCQLCTLNAATGLEAPVVFLLGLDHLLDRETSPLLSPEEQAELHASQTSLLYMAFTRAGQRLVIFTTNPSRAQSLSELR